MLGEVDGLPELTDQLATIADHTSGWYTVVLRDGGEVSFLEASVLKRPPPSLAAADSSVFTPLSTDTVPFLQLLSSLLQL